MMTLPKEMSRYLLTMAATISVPPVEPPAEKPSPIPHPQNTAPKNAAQSGWLWRRCRFSVWCEK